MSNVSPDQPEFDFWNFVSCARCRMPFALDNGSATVPFWLTECGHVICNSHLSPDQSCSQCGARDIQLAPLQREMEAPMSEWFQSMPRALESVAFASKFQQDMMASQIQYYKSKYQQCRHFVERLRRDVSELKMANESLRQKNEQILKNTNNVDSDVLNSNGKRQMIMGQQSNRPKTGSSPLSINNHLAPNRLTLLPGQQPPELSHPTHEHGQQRPISRALEQYMYIPPENNNIHPPSLTHAQAPLRALQRTQVHGHPPQQDRASPVRSRNEQSLISPSSSRFNHTLPFPNNNLVKTSDPLRPRQRNMGPPPTPQHVQRNQAAAPNNQRASNQSFLPPPSRQQTGLANSNSRMQPNSTSATPQRFFPATGPPSASSRGTSRALDANLGSLGGQRMPFIPDSRQQSGFG